jgi:hypothetical protein
MKYEAVLNPCLKNSNRSTLSYALKLRRNWPRRGQHGYSNWRIGRSHPSDSLFRAAPGRDQIQRGHEVIAGAVMSNHRFSSREMRFLQLYLGGAFMKDAARAAGYRGASDQALCNTGRAILTKFSANPKALFCWPGLRQAKIAQLLCNMADVGRPGRQIIALKILAKCIGG